MMRVRTFRLSDYTGVTQLMSDVLSTSCYDATINALGKQLSWDSELVFVAENSTGIVGVIIGTIDNNKGYYYRVAVNSEHQRMGIGKAMIQRLKKRFLFRKVKKILVSVDTYNESIIPLYESLGY